MNTVLAGIYGTGGIEKVASAGGQDIKTLSDLSLAVSYEVLGDQLKTLADDVKLEKVAAVQQEVFDSLVEFDRSGRAMAHHEFSQMEEQASKGNWEPLESFFAEAAPPDEGQAKLAAVKAELARRLQS